MTGSTNTSQCSQKLAKKEDFDIKPNFEDEEETLENDSESEFDGYEEQESRLWKKRLQKNVKWLECTTVTLWFDEKKEPYFSTKSGIFGYFLADRNWKCHNNFLNEDEVRNYKNKDCERKKNTKQNIF